VPQSLFGHIFKMKFRCRTGTETGEILEETYLANSESQLRRELEEKGLTILSLKGHGFLGGLQRNHWIRKKISSKEFLVFNQELATLLKAGMPLVQSLEILRQRVTNDALKVLLDTVCRKVKSGVSLSGAFAEEGALVSPMYSASLMAGERSGSLDVAIRRYINYEKVLRTVRQRTISALIYPTILLFLMSVLVGIIVLQVVPAFSNFYDTFDQQLPLSTQAIVSLSDFLVKNFSIIIIGLPAILFAMWAYLKSSSRRIKIDSALIQLPLVGQILWKFSTSQLARTLSTLLGGGIPLVNAIEVSLDSVQNKHLAKQLSVVKKQVSEGESFSSSLLAHKVFPDVGVKMVEVGESTGALQEMLNSLADFYDEEIEREVSRFIALIEPVVLVIMGVVIAAVVLALYLPLFELSSVIGG